MDKQNMSVSAIGGNTKGDRRELDFYPTPPDVTIALMEFLSLKRDKIVWEPACGDKAMSSVIKRYVDTVLETDIKDGIDFFSITKDVDVIITNPPFLLAEQFIRKALNEADCVAMVLKSHYWHAKKRYALYVEHPPTYILPMTWRPDFLGKGGPTMDMMWTVWIKGCPYKEYIPLLRP